MIDLNLYIQIIQFFQEWELEHRTFGGGEAAFEWASRQGLSEDDLGYVLQGAERLTGRWSREPTEWELLDRRPHLDRLVWTFHRAWIDRYGCQSASRHRLAEPA